MEEFKRTGGIIYSNQESDIVELVRDRARKAIEENLPGPEIQRFLDSVDFPLLRSIFSQIASRCGISEKDLNLVDKAGFIEFTDGMGGHGQYFSLENIIAMTTTSNPDFY